MERIILVAQQLAKEGKTPNTALIKARLPKNIPLPLIIQGLRCWQEAPEQQINMPTERALTSASSADISVSINDIIDSKIAQAITPLKAEISELKAQVKIVNALLEAAQKTKMED